MHQSNKIKYNHIIIIHINNMGNMDSMGKDKDKIRKII